ncbi:MAG TPA: hypothetical protein VGE01_05530 [Fimbriimonas sp.]
MRLLPLLLFGLCVPASADRLLSIPTGRKIPFGTVRFEAMSELSRGRAQEYFLGFGLTTYFDVEVRSEYFSGSDPAGSFDVSYNFIAPIPDITPGISVGVQDALDNLRDGRRFYGAFTLRPVFSTINGDVPADLTLGFFLGTHSAPFAGGTIPFSREFRLLYEYNGIRITSGLEVLPRPDLALRLVFRDEDVLGSVQYTRRF